ncbi:MAG: efflux RND transporter periplasmic adaptor subunit [Gammaproteobacteria bacterium]|nr:efflux RND transporter periplasmic adaptor subunit [Gammaproteobacteria bacterium]
MNRVTVISVFITLVIGMGFGFYLGQSQTEYSAATTGNSSTEVKPLYYRHPMNPSVSSPVPAKDEMGMDYIPVYAERSTPAVVGTVTIDPVTLQNIGVRTAIAAQKTMTKNIRAVGRVVYDETRMTRLHPKTEGWIENLRVNKTGELVKSDQILLDIYSPIIVTSLEEYLLALKSAEVAKQSGSADAYTRSMQIVESARKRLELLDVPAHQVEEFEQSGEIPRTVHIHSPFEGVVINIGAREGQYITPRTELYMIADLSVVWLHANVYEYELPWIQEGDAAEIEVSAVPGRIFTGEITYIYPYMEPDTRTVKVRFEIDNREGLLKPEMFANVSIMSRKQVDAVVVPSEAIVRSGARNQLFVVIGHGKFEPREVTLGMSSSGETQILKGLSPGEEVVTSSQFLIDSESKLREATAKMMAAMNASSSSTAVTNGAHDMSAMQSMKGMEHSDDMQIMEKMEHSDDMHDMGNMEGMEHSDEMQDMPNMEGMEHPDEMHDMHNMEGMDHSDEMRDMHNMEGMDHSGGMDSTQNEGGMNHD